MRQFINDDGDLTITGELVNFTGSTQTLNFIGGEFFDDNGTKIAGDDEISDYWLTDDIPNEGRLPFELSVDGIQQTANFTLTVDAEPAPGTIFSDAEITVTNQYREPEYYCLEGTVLPVMPFQDYLEVLATGYAADGSIVSFSDDYFTSSNSSGAPIEFSVCLDDTDPPTIDRHVLQIWSK